MSSSLDVSFKEVSSGSFLDLTDSEILCLVLERFLGSKLFNRVIIELDGEKELILESNEERAYGDREGFLNIKKIELFKTAFSGQRAEVFRIGSVRFEGVGSVAYFEEKASALSYFLSEILEIKRKYKNSVDGVTALSHDLRGAFYALDSAIHEEQMELRRILLHTKRIERELRSSFNWTRLSTPPCFWNYKSIDVKKILFELLGNHKESFDLFFIDYKLEFSDETLQILGDWDLLMIALDNLVINAIKYGGSFGNLICKAYRELDFVIVDLKNSVKENYEELHRNRKNKEQIGLKLVNQVISGLGAEIELSSDSSFFYVKLKFKSATLQQKDL